MQAARSENIKVVRTHSLWAVLGFYRRFGFGFGGEPEDETESMVQLYHDLYTGTGQLGRPRKVETPLAEALLRFAKLAQDGDTLATCNKRAVGGCFADGVLITLWVGHDHSERILGEKARRARTAKPKTKK